MVVKRITRTNDDLFNDHSQHNSLVCIDIGLRAGDLDRHSMLITFKNILASTDRILYQILNMLLGIGNRSAAY